MTINHITAEDVIQAMQQRIDELAAEVERLRQPPNVEQLCDAFDKLSPDDKFEVARHVLTKARKQ